MTYSGYQILNKNNNDISNFYQGNYNSLNFKENEYLIIGDDEQHINNDYYIFKNNSFERVSYPVLKNSFTGEMKPLNREQYCAMDLLKRDDIPVKLITGKFGSGKSMMFIVAALEALQDDKFEKIIFVRNNVQVKDTDSIGALPGEMLDKTLPYVMPFADHCGGVDGIKMLIEQDRLEVIPLAFLRGRSIRNAILYSMESENLTKEHIQLIMGRVDKGSQLWLDGDTKQRDKAVFEKSQGLEKMIETLSGNPLFGYVHLVKSERSEVAQLCDLLDN